MIGRCIGRSCIFVGTIMQPIQLQFITENFTMLFLFECEIQASFANVCFSLVYQCIYRTLQADLEQ